jgi:hypothetical protein
VSESSPERPAGDDTDRRRAAGAIPSGLADASPTWELELLLSGAVLVALFQVSGIVDRTFDRLMPHFGRSASIPLFFAYWYGKAMVLALIATFVLHLASRGYWVGLVGLNSVFPRGVKWDELKYGPITREVIRERLPSLPPVIARLDNFCSALFSFGFLLVLFFGYSLLLAGFVGAIAYALSLLLFDGRRMIVVFYAVLGVLIATSLIVTLLDRRLGAKLDPDSAAGRALHRMARMYYWTMGLPLYGPIMLTLNSNTRRRVFAVVLYVALFGILAVVTLQLFARQGDLEVNNYVYFAKPDAYSVNARYYESQRRRDDALPRTPTIQSDVIRDPYVKLFIPLHPERHNRALARCPGVQPLRPLGIQLDGPDGDVVPDSSATALLRCLAQLHAVTLNGSPLTNLELRFYQHPGNSLRGVIAYIPTAGLPRGRNVLTVQQVPRVPLDDRPPPPVPPRSYVIPFWL